MTIDILQRLGLALAIGLLIGVERGWREREGKPGSRAAGIRTHSIMALLGAVWGLVGVNFGEITLGLGAAAFVLAFTAFEWREGTHDGNLSATGLVAGILAFSLGIYVIRGDMAAAAAVAVVSTFILTQRDVLHRFLENIKWVELRDGLLLLLMSIVLLPVMPNYPIDPWGALNPFQLWLVTILIAATSYGGYIAVRLAGAQKGPFYAGLAGGLVSSTTVTWTFARLARRKTLAGLPLTAGILSSWIVSLLRMFIVAGAMAPALIIPLSGPILSAACVLLTVCAWLYWQGRMKAPAEALLQLEHPFELFSVLRFAALIAAIALVSEWIKPFFGQYGLFGIAASSGLADVNPITIAMAQATGKTVDPDTAAQVILTAALANLTAKCSLAWVFGGWRFAMPLWLTAGAAVAVGAWVLP